MTRASMSASFWSCGSKTGDHVQDASVAMTSTEALRLSGEDVQKIGAEHIWEVCHHMLTSRPWTVQVAFNTELMPCTSLRLVHVAARYQRGVWAIIIDKSETEWARQLGERFGPPSTCEVDATAACFRSLMSRPRQELLNALQNLPEFNLVDKMIWMFLANANRWSLPQELCVLERMYMFVC